MKSFRNFLILAALGVLPVALLLVLLAVLFAVPQTASAQTLKPGEWQTYTSMRSTTDVALASDSLHAWVATGGGAYEVDLRSSGNAPIALRTTDGLSENELTAVAADGHGNAYFGGANGGFDLYNSTTRTIRQLGTDIEKSSFTNKAINGITVFGGTVYLATAYGLTVFNAQDSAFAETVTEIAGLPSQDSIRQVLDDGTHVYAAMEEGVVVARDALDLHAGSNWTLIPDTGGAVRSLAAYRGTIYAGAENGVFVVSLAQDSLIPVAGSPASVNRLIVAHDSLCILDQSGNLFTTGDLQNFSRQASSAGSTALAVAPDSLGGFVLASAANGIAFPSADSLVTNLFPPGPIINAAQFLYFSTFTGELYVTHLGAGFDAFHPDSGIWNDFASGTGTTPNAQYLDVLYDSVRNLLWLSSIGQPLLRVQSLESDSPIWMSFDSAKISPYDHDYMRTAGLMVDHDGNLAVTSWSGDGNGLSVTSDGVNFTRYSLQPVGPEPWEDVTQDLDGNYWIGTTNPGGEPPPVGVYWLRKSDGLSGFIQGGQSGTLGNGVEGTEDVSSVLTDQDDAVWCGTAAGVEIISNPYAIEQPNPVFSIRSVPFLATQDVHTMAVDGVGNKWIGTDNGIFVVSPDGADSVARFTKENSPLVDNVVISLAIDPRRGEVYAGTPSGISRFSTIFKQGNPDYSSIRVYPNPVVQTGEGGPQVYIDGLVAGSTVQIFSLRGRLINTINGTALGSTVTWNGLDALGREVPTGMYLISATSAQTGDNGEAKVVIVRKP